MNLLQQFQGVLGSLLLGGLFYFFFELLKIGFNHKYLKLIWYIVQPVYFLSAAYIYYLFLCFFTYGIYNFFFTISLFGGIIIYHLFYHPNINKALSPLSRRIDLKINRMREKITNHIANFKVKIKKNEKQKAKENKK